MATSNNQSEALHKFEEQLTCSICLEQYSNPKILPCFHSFCLDCLNNVRLKMTQQEGIYSLPCPTCRSPCQLPQQGVNELPSSFTINNLTEVYNLMKKVTGKVHPSCDKCQKNEADRYCQQCAKFLCQQCLQHHDEWMTNHKTLGLDEVANAANQLHHPGMADTANNCPEHSTETTKIYCETCEKLICQLCTVNKHKDHIHDALNDAYCKHMKIIQQSSLQSLDQKISALGDVIANLIGRREEIAEQGGNTKQMAHETVAQMKELLDQTERKINEEVGRAQEYKFTVIDYQMKEAKTILGQLTEWRDHMQQSLAVDTPQQVLSTKAQMVRHTESLLKRVEKKKFQPIEEADFRLVKNDKKSIDDIPSYIGTVEYFITPPRISRSFDRTPIVGQESTVNISLSLEDGSPAPLPFSHVTCYLTPPSDPSHRIQCTLKETSKPDQHCIVFTPCTRGYHQLHVKLYNRTILGNPVSIPVSVPVTLRGSVVKTIKDIGSFDVPRGIVVSNDGKLLISEFFSHCIVIVARDGEKTSQMFGSSGSGRGQLKNPFGIAITSVGTLLVVDRGNHRIQEFTMNGECLSCVGSKGNGPLQFDTPFGIAINKTTGQVYVIEAGNYRVQVLNADLSFSHMFGSRGSGHGQFCLPLLAVPRLPLGLAIDSQGFVYVADCGNNRIQKFTPEGQFVSAFGSKGSNPGQLSHPLNVFIDNDDLLYVSESSGISVYTTTGQYVHQFGSTLSYPYGIAMDSTTGYLYVCSRDGVIVF